jgi:hypothetical protein
MAGCLNHMAIASFRSLASIIPTPPNCSFVSIKGPSVTDALPSLNRTLTAALATIARWYQAEIDKLQADSQTHAYIDDPTVIGPD